LPVAVMVTVICFESTATFSAQNTSGWIRPWMERFFGHINDTVWSIAHHLMRKSGHFTGYGTLCLTWLRAWLLTLARRGDSTTVQWRLRSCGLAILGTFAIASLDEWHQTFLPSRTGMFSDVVLDTVGGTAMCCLVGLVWWWRSRRVWTSVESGREKQIPAG
jgi:VanZ family protein